MIEAPRRLVSGVTRWVLALAAGAATITAGAFCVTLLALEDLADREIGRVQGAIWGEVRQSWERITFDSVQDWLLEEGVIEAMREGDAAVIERLLADGFIGSISRAGIVSIAVHAPDSTLVARYTGTRPAERVGLPSALPFKEIGVSVLSDGAGFPRLTIPVHDHDRKFLGYIVARSDETALVERMSDKSNWALAIRTLDGRLLTDARFPKAALAHIDEDTAGRMTLEENGRTFWTYPSITGTGLGLFFAYDVTESLEALFQRFLPMVFGAVFGLGLIAWTGVRYLRRRLDPIRALSSRLGEVLATGLWGATVPVSGDDEVAALARNFNEVSIFIADQIRRLEQAEQDARASSRAKSAFLANMSHEIRTPLNGVLGVAEMLEGRLADAENKRLLDTLIRSGRSLLAIVNDVLDLSKIEAGRFEIVKEVFHPREIFDDVRGLFEARAIEAGIRLDVAMDRSVPDDLRGDPLRLSQVVRNLVSNGVKFTERGGVSLRVRFEQKGDTQGRLCVEVEDTGIGIDPETSDQLFDKFHQADDTLARRYEGTGLGLAISKSLVERMGGRIGCTGAPGKGATFHFTIPMEIPKRTPAGPTGEADPTVAQAAAVPERLSGHVLVVDDNKVNRMVARALVQKVGLTTSEAEDGREALDALDREAFDLVLMDCHMPVIDGFEATRRIRALPEPSGRVPVIAMTALAGSGDRERCLAAGMDDFVSKPIDRTVFLQALARWLGSPTAKSTS